jgi:hypothetical protein
MKPQRTTKGKQPWLRPAQCMGHIDNRYTDPYNAKFHECVSMVSVSDDADPEIAKMIMTDVFGLQVHNGNQSTAKLVQG